MTGWQDGVQLVQIARGISSPDVCGADEKQGNRKTGKQGKQGVRLAFRQESRGWRDLLAGHSVDSVEALVSARDGRGMVTGWSHGVCTRGKHTGCSAAQPKKELRPAG